MANQSVGSLNEVIAALMVPALELLLHFVLGPIGVIWAWVAHGIPTSLAEAALVSRWISGFLGTLTWHGVASAAS